MTFSRIFTHTFRILYRVHLQNLHSLLWEYESLCHFICDTECDCEKFELRQISRDNLVMDDNLSGMGQDGDSIWYPIDLQK